MMNRTAWLIAQASADKSSRLLADILPWLIAIVGVILVGGIAIYFIRRWLRSEDGDSPVGFTLHDLRDLHVRGEISDEEFARARQQMIGRLKQPIGTSVRPAKTNPPGNHDAASN